MQPIRSFTTAPTANEIEAMAERALAAIPPALRKHVAGVGIMVEDLADDETLAELGIDNPYELTGLYSGTPLHLQFNDAPVRAPNIIHLYREAILLEWIELGEDLHRLVRNVLIHEIAHHFGFSDDEITALEQGG
jgi:acetylglutamate kinase